MQKSHFILDTGFTGDLLVTTSIAKELGLKVDGVMPFRHAGGQIMNIPTATAFGVMEGKTLYVTVAISENAWPLLGISFVQKFNYKAIVDCKNKKVTLEVVV